MKMKMHQMIIILNLPRIFLPEISIRVSHFRISRMLVCMMYISEIETFGFFGNFLRNFPYHLPSFRKFRVFGCTESAGGVIMRRFIF